MKKRAVAFAILIVTIMILISIFLNAKTVRATDGSNYTIDHVEHTIKVLYNGYIFINDTIQISGQASDGFLMGFPYNYGPYVIRCVAYNSSDIFPVSLDVPLEDNIGFYGVKVNFTNGTPQVFTVGFILSNKLLTAISATRFTLDFPAYPSLTKSAAINASLLVENATYVDGTMGGFKYGEENLPAFTSMPVNVTFDVTSGKIQLFDIKVFQSEIMINQIGEIIGSDYYYITNNEPVQVGSIEVTLPPNAFNPSAQDQFGRSMSSSAWTDERASRYNASFTAVLGINNSMQFSVKYSLPSNYSVQMDATNFNFTFPLFQGIDYYIEKASVTFVLPEGARILDFKNTLTGSAYDITKNVFQETVVINSEDVSYLENVLPSENVLQLTYEYNPLWSSFRPTLWMWTLAIVGCAIVVVWRRPKAPAPVVVPTGAVRLQLEDVRSFVDLYEEKKKITLESESLETMVRKGRVPRRRYKVRKKTLEIRLSTLSRSLTELKEGMRAAGGKYADLMRQLEIAETETNEAEAGIKSIEARHSRGEISLETYRKLLTDYERRKEKAEATINGILLRLREEIH
jgi:DNA-binding HxlR family transcriptional regulator